MTEDQEEEKSPLNNPELQINRGVELLLRNRRRSTPKPKTFQIKFGNLIALWNREIVFHFDFYLRHQKKVTISGRSAMSETLVVTLTLTTVVSALALLVGGMIGWMARQHSYETTPQVVYTHPEMFDANGQLVPDEILALRIETHDTDEENDD